MAGLTKIEFGQARPVDGQPLAVPQPEMFILHINRAFGSFPVELDAKNIPTLEGMAATWTSTAENPYDKLKVAIKRLGSVKIYAVYGEE